MPPALHATLSDPKERVIIVGDVHGCLDELNALLGACEYTEERDTVILVGDLASSCVTCFWRTCHSCSLCRPYGARVPVSGA